MLYSIVIDLVVTVAEHFTIHQTTSTCTYFHLQDVVNFLYASIRVTLRHHVPNFACKEVSLELSRLIPAIKLRDFMTVKNTTCNLHLCSCTVLTACTLAPLDVESKKQVLYSVLFEEST